MEVRVRVRLRSCVMHFESPHKDGSPRVCVCVFVCEMSLQCFQVNEVGQSCLQPSRKELILLLKADSCGFNRNLPPAG